MHAPRVCIDSLTRGPIVPVGVRERGGCAQCERERGGVTTHALAASGSPSALAYEISPSQGTCGSFLAGNFMRRANMFTSLFPAAGSWHVPETRVFRKHTRLTQAHLHL